MADRDPILEEWKDIPGFEGIYRVSSFGRVCGYPKKWESGSWKSKKVIIFSLPDREFKGYVDAHGYKVIGLRQDGKQRIFRIHRLVAKLFIPNPHNKLTVNHIDCDKLNNHISNLEWATSSENMQHAHDNNLITTHVGEAHAGSKLTSKDVLFIRSSNLLQKELAQMYKVSPTTIKSIKHRKTWKHL